MASAEVIKLYLEVGVLGLCAILMIVIFYENHKRSHVTDDKKNELITTQFKQINDKIDGLVTNLQEQNNNFIKLQEKHYEEEKERSYELVTAIINGVVNHVPSVEENKKLTNVNTEIDEILQEILMETNASRVNLVQYHNGGKGVNQQAFLKMSMTNEKFQYGMKAVMPEFKDQFRSVLGYFVNKININGNCYINNVENILHKDVGMYEFMKNRGVQAKYGYAIHKEGNVIGFIDAEYTNSEKANEQKIDNCFKEHYRQIEKLLNT